MLSPSSCSAPALGVSELCQCLWLCQQQLWFQEPPEVPPCFPWQCVHPAGLALAAS